MYRIWKTLESYSLLLIFGAVAALIWANFAPDSYRHFVHFPLAEHAWIGHPHGDEGRTLTVHYLINDMLMAFFFALAGKEVWEAVGFSDGELRGRKAFTPLIATAGGMIGPALIYVAGAILIGKTAALSVGWAIPTATDIAFSYLVGRIVFGAGHPAVRFLLLLAIADDAGGLLILAIFYPTAELAPQWLLLSFGAALLGYLLLNRLPRRLDRGDQTRRYSTFMRRKLRFWPWLVVGAASWFGFQQSGLHPALGLLPVIPAIPNADVTFGIFAEEEAALPDLLNSIQNGLKGPVELVLLLFGLANAGVEFSALGAATWLVLAGLMIGKPLGILGMGWLAAQPLGFGLPEGMKPRDLFVIGCVAGIGFTVALFVASVAFAPGAVQDAAKMGALLSFAGAGVSILAGRLCKVERRAA